ncbi:MAG: conjugal transfer protein TraX [Butyrivibrio sp.]|nr:conjugal transfer protein TraX [Butyrivibrio sp.]
MLPENLKKLNGNCLKLIACLTMLIDHATAGIMIPAARNGLLPDDIPYTTLNLYYRILRGIGRVAFPIFCFLLVEGFIHTKNRLRYALGLLIFGFISEPFYDVTFFAEKEEFNLNIFEVLSANRGILFDHCNVYFTLFIGLIVIWAIEKSFYLYKELQLPIWLSYVFSCCAIATGIVIAELLHTDYHGFGVALIVVLYVLRYIVPLNLFAGYMSICTLSTEYLAFTGFLLLLLYNGKRGRALGRMKYAFYIFYPLHIYLIYLIRCLVF